MKRRLFDILAIIIVLLAISWELYSQQQLDQISHKLEISIDYIEPINVVVNAVDSLQYKTVTYYDIPLSCSLQDYINEECNENNVEYELVLAIMKVESDYNPKEVSETNDYGIMQINECNHDELKSKLNITDFLDPYDSTKAGVYMLSNYKWCENESQMLMCYNMGVAGARKCWKQGVYESSYSRKVLKEKEKLGGKKYEVNVLCN